MELRHYLSLLARRWLFLVGVIVIAVAVAFAVSPKSHTYVADSTLYVGSRVVNSAPTAPDLTYERVAALDRIVQTFAVMIDSEPIAQRALQKADIQRSASDLVDNTTVEAVKNTLLLKVSVSDSSPVVAQKLSNALVDSFVEAIQQYEPGQASGGTDTGGVGQVPTLPAYVFAEATLPTKPLPSGLLVNLVIAAVLGAGLGVAMVILVDYLDVTVRSAEEAEERIGLPVLGTIPDFGGNLPRPSLTRS